MFIGLPGGSRTEGLQQLQLCAEKGELGRPEAKFYLAKDYSRGNERQYEKSLHLFAELQQEFPHNPLWPMLIGSLHYRLGRPQKARNSTATSIEQPQVRIPKWTKRSTLPQAKL